MSTDRGPAPGALRVLLVEDNPCDVLVVQALVAAVAAPRIALLQAGSLAEARAVLAGEWVDAVLLDLSLPDAVDMEALQALHDHHPCVPVVVLTGRDDAETGMRALQLGAQDYLRKAGTEPEVLARSLRYAVERFRLLGALRGELGRREAAEALARGREEGRERALSLLRATMEATADGILVVDTERRVSGSNLQYVRMWGVAEPLPGMADDRALLESIREQVLDFEGFRTRVDELYATPAAEASDVVELTGGRFFERYTRPQTIAGEIVGRVWSFRDVTDRLHLEARVRHEEKMEAVGRLAGGIAHDFNNVLTTIKGTTALLLADLPAGSALLEDLEAIAGAADRAASLTGQLLALGRRQVLHPTTVHLNDLVSASAKVLARMLGDRVRIVTRLDPALGRVRVDAEQIHQVLVSLALNARDAMAGGGTLTLQTRNLAPADEGARGVAHPVLGAVQLLVRDTGHGMSPEVQDRIFEPFFTSRPNATGLGLATAYGVVEQSGGLLTVSSAPAAGATFSLAFPRLAEEPAPPAAARGEPGTSTVLLVDDEEPVRNLVARILQRGGHHVLRAAGGEEAMRVAEAHPGRIHLLLTDVIMPGLTGPRLAERLCAVRTGLRVLFMSGYTEEEIPADSLPAGALGLLQKPFEPHELLSRVRHCLSDPLG